jgi:glycerol kinase
LWRVARRFEPRMCEDKRRALLEQWRRALARARGWATPGG